MPPNTATNNATIPSVAASLERVDRVGADAPHRVGDDRHDDEGDRPEEHGAQQPVQEHRLRPLSVAKVRRVLDVHLVPVTAHAAPRHLGILYLQRDCRDHAVRDAEPRPVREEPVPDHDTRRRRVAELRVVLEEALDPEPTRRGRFAIW